jgi:hypothetical protein
MQRTPAGFPSGMPGMGLVMDGAVQQAPQLSRQCMGVLWKGTVWHKACSMKATRLAVCYTTCGGWCPFCLHPFEIDPNSFDNQAAAKT